MASAIIHSSDMERVQRHGEDCHGEREEGLAILSARRPGDLHFGLLSGNLSDVVARAGLVYELAAKLSDET